MFSYFLKWELLLGPFLSLLFRDGALCWLELQVWEIIPASSSPVSELHVISWRDVNTCLIPPDRTLTHQRNNSTQVLLGELMGSLGLLFRSMGKGLLKRVWVTHQLLYHCKVPPQRRYKKMYYEVPFLIESCVLLYTLASTQNHVYLGQEELTGRAPGKDLMGNLSNFFC